MFDKLDRILDNIENKVNSLNRIFSVINKTTTSIDLISTRVVNAVFDYISAIFKKKKGKDGEHE